MGQRVLDEDVMVDDSWLDDVDRSEFLTQSDEDLWTEQSEDDEIKNWELGFEFGEQAARNDFRRWNDGDY